MGAALGTRLCLTSRVVSLWRQCHVATVATSAPQLLWFEKNVWPIDIVNPRTPPQSHPTTACAGMGRHRRFLCGVPSLSVVPHHRCIFGGPGTVGNYPVCFPTYKLLRSFKSHSSSHLF